MSPTEKNEIAEWLATKCAVPITFAKLVLEVETDNEWPNSSVDEVMLNRQNRLHFLDRVASLSDWSTDVFGEFETQCIALRHNVPIQLARIVINAESDEIIPEDTKVAVRDERIVFLSKVFALLSISY